MHFVSLESYHVFFLRYALSSSEIHYQDEHFIQGVVLIKFFQFVSTRLQTMFNTLNLFFVRQKQNVILT